MRPFIVFSPPGEVPEALHPLGDAVDIVRISDLAAVEADAQPAVLIFSAELAERDLLSSVPRHVTVLAKGPEARAAADSIDRLFLDLDDLSSAEAQLRAIRSAARVSATELARSKVASQLDELRGDLRGLNEIGMALMSERDPDVVLEMILTEARHLTISDGGSLYLVEEEGGTRTLHFLRAQNDSLPDLPMPDFSLPFDDASVAGYVALHGRPLRIEDAYHIPESEPYSHNPSFDREHGYRSRSMLIVPMKDHRDTVVGVLQLINKKSDSAAVIRDEASTEQHVRGYEERDVELVQSLAGQAAVSIENGRLYEDIENLFEGFIKASVIAIDQRDPTTSGHSVRVATLTCDIAEVADRANDGPFRDTKFSREQMRELRYAGLLHDFGKVGVREDVLVKSKKLPPVLLERIEARFDLIRRTPRVGFSPEAGRAPAQAWQGRFLHVSAESGGGIRELPKPGRPIPGGHSRVQRAQSAARSQCGDPRGYRGHHLPRLRRSTGSLRHTRGAPLPLHSKGLPGSRRAASDRITRHSHVQLPQADPVDHQPRPGSRHRPRTPRETRWHGLPEGDPGQSDRNPDPHHDGVGHFRRVDGLGPPVQEGDLGQQGD